MIRCVACEEGHAHEGVLEFASHHPAKLSLTVVGLALLAAGSQLWTVAGLLALAGAVGQWATAIRVDVLSGGIA